MKESEIRDKLVKDLKVINKDYTFLEKEKFIKPEIGTRCFIDIFAKNSNGKYVIIELKRSNAAAREAIHELLKYFEAVKEILSCNSDDLEMVVISTEWEELFRPFSTFVNTVDFTVYGYKLIIENNILKSERITPMELIEERFLSSIQCARFYLDKESLNLGIKEHEAFFTHIK